MSNEFYFEADGKLHRAAWMPALGIHYESIWNGHSWDHQGRMDEEQELDLLNATLRPLLAKRAKLEFDLRDAESREWIAANKVIRADVQYDREDGLPWFNMIQQFIEWLKVTNCQKTWATWNGRIYSVAELLRGRMLPGIAKYGDLPE